ncbi:MAG: hypothetical protein EBV14_01005, partial [Actinobacteria bacterium]|nr:hypothetical protein [Actinomycetota bacterium]
MPAPKATRDRVGCVTQPTPPIEFGEGAVSSRWSGPKQTGSSSALVGELEAICPTSTTQPALAEHARDWWPLAMRWALQAQVPRLPAA